VTADAGGGWARGQAPGPRPPALCTIVEAWLSRRVRRLHVKDLEQLKDTVPAISREA